MTMAARLPSALIGWLLVLPLSTVHADEIRLKNTPFAYGDQAPDLTANCETIGDWSKKAPSGDMRIDLAIKGPLSQVSFDGALAYLVMCKSPDVTVTCVTYSTNGMAAGDVVRFGGGFAFFGRDRIMLDPCLASRE